ncbi:hypothetical protein EDB98_106284 [Pseudomonas fluorescens]|nr:hypothetical protein EDB98_106284 [Pseudomonas fluorescens]SFW58724.1 hypothetical protein SAMN03159439_02892 [Pseudomonas sp. NFACC04-2]
MEIPSSALASVDFHRGDSVALQHRKPFVGLLPIQPFQQVRLTTTRQRQAQQQSPQTWLQARNKVPAGLTPLRTSTLSRLIPTLYCLVNSCRGASLQGE